MKLNWGLILSLAANFGVWIVLAWTLYGCGGSAVFAKTGAGVSEFEADNYDCEQAWERTAGAIAFRQDPIGNAYFGFARSGDIQKCLERKGWARATK
jgi:hypothetical protein